MAEIRTTIKATIKLFVEGDENNFSVMTYDIPVTQKFGKLSPDNSSILRKLPEQVSAFLLSRLQATPDQELVDSIKIFQPGEPPLAGADQPVSPETTPHPIETERPLAPPDGAGGGGAPGQPEEVAVTILDEINPATTGEISPLQDDLPDFTVEITEMPLEIEVTHRPPQPRRGKLNIIASESALNCAKKHALEDRGRETGGVLIGAYHPEANGDLTVLVTGIVRAIKAVRQTAAVNFTPETWAEIWRLIDGHPTYGNDQVWKIVGWYHTHPSFDVFFSAPDHFIHEEYFTDPGHIALVIDPVKGHSGYYVWDRNGELQEYPYDQGVDDDYILRELNRAGIKQDDLPDCEIVK